MVPLLQFFFLCVGGFLYGICYVCSFSFRCFVIVAVPRYLHIYLCRLFPKIFFQLTIPRGFSVVDLFVCMSGDCNWGFVCCLCLFLAACFVVLRNLCIDFVAFLCVVIVCYLSLLCRLEKHVLRFCGLFWATPFISFLPFQPGRPKRYLCKHCGSRWDGVTSRLIRIYTVCHSVFSYFRPKPYLHLWTRPNAKMEESTFRNSEIKWLIVLPELFSLLLYKSTLRRIKLFINDCSFLTS